ncbi:hypothetical protein [Nannocystis pusilla]|uniref:Uncharacterized protein n=1 Tax=Nannocystis pusilla TaxID=889268 RepID=A0ABS7TMW2_9BACT|nr:hypothetical protein [Nannocystis pusilla]MBZ5709564.1 hypothetical protein [Nannocystis pusilla]
MKTDDAFRHSSFGGASSLVSHHETIVGLDNANLSRVLVDDRAYRPPLGEPHGLHRTLMRVE